MNHPYQEYEGHAAWDIVEQAVNDLIENGDLEAITPRAYIVGYMIKRLADEEMLTPQQPSSASLAAAV